MKLRFTERADRDYADLPPPIRKAFAKQLRFPMDNLQHRFVPRNTIKG
jgi:mRNA-degrading endonuclease RelE of RelBE toxin-antitoxin system